MAATIPFLTSVSADNIPFLYILKTKFTMVSNRAFLSYSIVLNSVFYNISYNEGLSICIVWNLYHMSCLHRLSVQPVLKHLSVY